MMGKGLWIQESGNFSVLVLCDSAIQVIGNSGVQRTGRIGDNVDVVGLPSGHKRPFWGEKNLGPSLRRFASSALRRSG